MALPLSPLTCRCASGCRLGDRPADWPGSGAEPLAGPGRPHDGWEASVEGPLRAARACWVCAPPGQVRPSAPHASPRPALSVSPAWPCGLGEGAFLSCPSSIAGPPGPPVGVCAPSPRFLPAVCSVKASVLGALQREPIPGSTPVPGEQVPPGVWHTPAPVLTQVWSLGVGGGGSVALRVCGALVVHLALTTAPRRGCFQAWLPPLLRQRGSGHVGCSPRSPGAQGWREGTAELEARAL